MLREIVRQWNTPPVARQHTEENRVQRGYRFDYPLETVNSPTGVPYAEPPRVAPRASTFMGIGRDSMHHGDRLERPVGTLSMGDILAVSARNFLTNPRVIMPVVTATGHLVVAVPIGSVPEILSPVPHGVDATAAAMTTHDLRRTLVGWENPFNNLY